MSLKTWKEEFYPIPASEHMPWKQTCEHSLRKWIGLRPENLQKHNVSLRPYQLNNSRPPLYLVDEDSMQLDDLGTLYEAGNILEIGGDSCALCLKSEHIAINVNEERSEEDDYGENDDDIQPVEMCEVCPIYFLTSDTCDGMELNNANDEEGLDQENSSPFEMFAATRDHLAHMERKRRSSPFGIFVATKRPEPMIQVLEETIKMLNERPKEFFVYITKKKEFIDETIAPVSLEDFKVNDVEFIALLKQKKEKELESLQKQLRKNQEQLEECERYLKQDKKDKKSSFNFFDKGFIQQQVEYYTFRINQVKEALESIEFVQRG